MEEKQAQCCKCAPGAICGGRRRRRLRNQSDGIAPPADGTAIYPFRYSIFTNNPRDRAASNIQRKNTMATMK
jgi:hypothetical protein